MKTLDYAHVPGDRYPHQITVRHYLFKWKYSERLFVSETGYLWFRFPSMHMITFSDDLEEVVRQESYVHGV